MTRIENHVVTDLPHRDRLRLTSLCERSSLVVSQVISEVSQPTAHVYFPLDAVVSAVAVTEEVESIGLALIGREGMLGSEVALGVFNHPLQTRTDDQPGASSWTAPIR